MTVIKCKMCGGELNLIEGSSTAECEFCGSVQTVPKVDNEKKLTLFARANRLRAACDFDKAAGIYESIISDFPEEAEAYWGLVLCKYGIEYVDDPATGKKVPTCHRSSFDSLMEDGDFDQAIENADEAALRIYRSEAKQIEELRKGILAVSSTEKPYDIFICYKETDSNGDRTVDSVLAQDIYDTLTSKGYRTFFSRVTLEDKLGRAYEPYIFAALNSAKIMLVVGTCYEHFNAVWVKNEWSRYLKIIAQDKNKYLIPCFKGIDAYDMPREFAHLQAQDMGKVGAIQDLLRGIEKILPRQQNTNIIQEKILVGGSGNNKIAALLDRGNMALEDGDWAKADSFFEDVLNTDSKNAQAYLGKTLATEKCRTIDAFIRKRKDAAQSAGSETLILPPCQDHIAEKVQQFSLPGYVSPDVIRKLYTYDLSYRSEVADRKQQYRSETTYWENHKWMSKAEKFAVGAVAENIAAEKKSLFAALSDRVKKAEAAESTAKARVQAAYADHIAKADAEAEKLYEMGLQRRQQHYQELLQIAKTSADIAQLKQTAQKFEHLGNYQDSRNLAEHCRKRAAEEQARLDAEAQRLQQEREKEEKARKARGKRNTVIALVIVALLFAAALFVSRFLIPNSQYMEAEKLLINGEYDAAVEAFAALDGFKNSDQIIAALGGLDALRNDEYDSAINWMLKYGMKIVVNYDCQNHTDEITEEFATTEEYSGLLQPTYEGYRFCGWQLYQFQYMAGGMFELRFRASWTDGYVIDYELNGGTAENPTIYHKEGDAITLNRPVKTGYTFLGWTGTDLSEPTLDVTIPAGSYGHRKYTANWQVNEYTFTLDANGGTVSETTFAAPFNSKYTLPVPQRDHYFFEGWYEGETQYVDGTWLKDADVTLVAKWTPISYTISYQLDGGTNAEANQVTFTVESPAIALADPAKTGYRFLGWYSDSGFSNKVTDIPAESHGNVTLYAKWEIITYTITYQLNGGSISGNKPTSFTVEDLPLALPTATKSNMVFLHWGLDVVDGKPITKISEIGNVTVVACFMDPNLQMKQSGSAYYVNDYSGSASTVTIPAYYEGQPVTRISSGAFSGCSSLVTINIPATITEIESSAFSNCSKLKNVVIPNSVTKIGVSAFAGCRALTSIIIPDSVTYIGDDAFDWCTALTTVTMPARMTYLGDSAFSFCESLQSIRVPEGITSLGFGVFYSCTSLTSVTLPSTLKSIDGYVFNECSSLKKIIIPASVTSMNAAFPGCRNLTIYCRANSIPSGWSSGWNNSRPVVWGYTGN